MKMNKEVVMVKLTDIIPNRFQPRLTFDEEALNELADSIREHGIIQPLILRSLGDKFEIIAGERRYKAATMAGLTEVPALVGNMDDQTSAELALIENIQRKDLSAIEEAKSYKKILEMGNFTQDQLAKRMGKSQSTIANKMRLLSLSNEAQMALMNNLISERHARCLLQVKDLNVQKDVLNKVINERMNVRKTDEYIKNVLGINTNENKGEQELNFESSTTPTLNNNISELQPKLNDNYEEAEPTIEPIAAPNNVENTGSNNPNIYAETNNDGFVNIFDLDKKIEEPKQEPKEVIKPFIEEPSISPIKEPTKAPTMEINKPKEETIKTTVSKPIDSMTKMKYASAIRIAKDSLSEITKLGYKAKLEEVNTDNDYQIIIKIEK